MKEPILTATFAEPVHFKLWTMADRAPTPYNLCDTIADTVQEASSRYTPLRSLVTCPACLERLR